MRQGVQIVILLGLVCLVAGCSRGKEKKEEPPPPAAATETADPNVVTGEALTDSYVGLLCQKYADCGIQAFTDDADCKTRIRALLLEDPEWKGLKLEKAKLDTCLADFKGLSCDDFQGGKSPPSCEQVGQSS